MKVAVVVDGHKIGEVDVYASTWLAGLPRDVRLDLDLAVCRGEIEFELKRKED